MKKILSAVLTAALALLLLCPVQGAEENRPVLTIGDIHDRTGDRIDGEDQLGLWQYLEDQLGVEIRFVQMTPESYASGLASGNLPDIVSTDNNLSTILESGVALDLDPYLEQYCPNFLQGDTRLSYDVYKQLLNEGDGFYFFPCNIGYNGTGYSNGSGKPGYFVRWDYYKELGYPPINNEDDYLKVLQQMQENHPFTEEGYPTYLFGSTNFTGYATAFRSEVSLDYWAAYKYQNNIFTNEIYDGYTDPAHSMWWSTMSFYNKLYLAGKDKGSFDLSIFTQTSDQYDVKCERGQYMGLHSSKDALYRRKVKEDPDTLAGYAMVPTAACNYYSNVYQLLGNGSAYMWFISEGSPRKEEALRLFNYMCDPYFLREAALGKQGVTWDYDKDGVPQMTEYGLEQMRAYKTGAAGPDNYYAKWGSYSDLPNNWPLLRNNMPHPDGYPLDFYTISREYMKETMTSNVARDICSHYDVELPSDAVYKNGGLDFRNDCGEAISSSITSLDRDQLHILDNAEALLNEVRVDLICAETDQDFTKIQDETIRKLIEMDEPAIFRAYQKKWNAAADVIVPLVRQVQTENGITPYTRDQYDRFPERGKEAS